ncbi:transposase [Methylicorpusculum oleiharenae]|nr:transposase [Methylicorpusculum oleiharenae]
MVVDKFDVIRMSNEAVEKVRKRVTKSPDNKMKLKLKNERFVLLKRHHDLAEADSKNLDKWSDLFPDRGVAYSFKERFFDVYAGSDPVFSWGEDMSLEPN